MVSFTLRKIRHSETLGETLRRHREEVRTSLEAAAASTAIPLKHLTSLEAGRYRELPGDVYIRNYLKRYAAFLELNPEIIVDRYESERRVHPDIPTSTDQPGPAAQPLKRQIALEPRLFRRIAIGFVVLVVLAYLGLEVKRIVGPPKLTVTQPAVDITVNFEQFSVTGQTEPESRIFINSQPVSVSRDGTFHESVDLQPGVNTLQIRAEKKNGKTTTVTRTILREVANN